MALRKCGSCGREVSSRAEWCPYCDAELSAQKPVEDSGTGLNQRLSRGEIVGYLVAAVLVVAITASGGVGELLKPLGGPFDPRPEITFAERFANPARVVEHKRELCEWAKREEKRNPLPFSTAMRESVCGPGSSPLESPEKWPYTFPVSWLLFWVASAFLLLRLDQSKTIAIGGGFMIGMVFAALASAIV